MLGGKVIRNKHCTQTTKRIPPLLLHLSSSLRHLFLCFSSSLNPSPPTPYLHSNTDITVRPIPPQLLCWYSDESLSCTYVPSLWKRHSRTHSIVELNTKWISELAHTQKEEQEKHIELPIAFSYFQPPFFFNSLIRKSVYLIWHYNKLINFFIVCERAFPPEAK